MTFQLVRASDNAIAVWQTEHGHVYVFTIRPDLDALEQRVMHTAPDASEPAQTFTDEALRFATEQARTRQLIGGRIKRRKSAGCSAELA